AAAVLLVPLPFRVTAPVVLQPEGEHRVYVSVSGRLSSAVREGVEVERGQMLARLEDPDVRMEIEELTGQRDRQRLHLQHLELRLGEDPSVAAQIPEAGEALADLEERLRQRERDEERLTLTAPVAGTVLPPAGLASRPYARNRLRTWSGSPLDIRNAGCHLAGGTLFCVVGDPERLEAILVVDQSDLVFVKTGQRVRLQLDELPAEVLGGTVTEIATNDLAVVPRELAVNQRLPSRVDESGISRPLAVYYQVRVSLDDHERRLLTGTSGRAKILVEPRAVGRRVLRYLRRTFRVGL
ncbi:MAG: HlyD family efflux transporter periplasmic adaptor subunit, partial [Planctomycetota bacterium]